MTNRRGPDLGVAGAHRARVGETCLGPQDRDAKPLEIARPSRSARCAAMTRATLSPTAAKSISRRLVAIPSSAPRRHACASLAAAISDFDGTQPKLRQSPPISPRSTSTTLAPHLRRARRDREPARAGADHAEIRGKRRHHELRRRWRRLYQTGSNANSAKAKIGPRTLG